MHLFFEDIDGLKYDIKTAIGDSAKLLFDGKEIDFEKIDRSFQPGAVIIGDRRQMSGEYSLQFSADEAEDVDMRAKIGNLLYWANRAVYLIDDDNDLRTKIALRSYSIPWENGSMLRSSIATLELIQLTPYWEDVDYTEVTGSGTNIVKSINNLGYLPADPLIVLTTATTTLGFSIWITENSEGMEIGDRSFGTTASLLVYTIDCEEGVVKLSTVERNDRIRGGTGFFSFPVGITTLNIVCDVSLSASIKWRRRYFI